MQHKNQDLKTPEKTEKAKDSVMLQSIAMAAGTGTSRVFGMLREMAFVAMYSNAITDAWNIAFRIPNMFRRLLGEGSLAVSFVPVFVEARMQDSSGVHARNLVNSFYSLMLVLLGVLTALGILFAEPLIGLLVDASYRQSVEKFELTVRMTQIMFGFIFFMSSYALFMGILNSMGRFALPAIAPTLFNFVMLLANFVPLKWQSVHGDALAYGVLIGGLLQAGVLLPMLAKLGFLPRWTWVWNHPGVGRIIKNMLPGMLGMGLMQITTLVNAHFASGLAEGSNTYINLADRLLELPLSLVAVSLGTALLPTLSQYWVQQDHRKMIDTANFYLRINLLVALPAAVGLFLLSAPIVELLFQRGRFDSHDVQVTSSILSVYAFTLLASSSVRVLVPNFYAMKNTWLPALVSGVCLTIHIVMAPYLIQKFEILGLVGSTLVSATLNAVLLLVSLRLLVGALGITKILMFFLRILVPLVSVILICMAYVPLREFVGDSLLARTGSLFFIIGSSMLIYFTLGRALGSSECSFVVDGILRRVKAKLSKKRASR